MWQNAGRFRRRSGNASAAKTPHSRTGDSSQSDSSSGASRDESDAADESDVAALSGDEFMSSSPRTIEITRRTGSHAEQHAANNEIFALSHPFAHRVAATAKSVGDSDAKRDIRSVRENITPHHT